MIGESGASASGNAHFDWLAHHLFGQSAPAPTAPYAYARLAGAPSRDSIWHADPVHVEAARDHLIVQSLGVTAPTAAETTQLIDVANELAAVRGCDFLTIGDRWFLRSVHEWEIDADPLEAMIDEPFTMPAGRDAQIWNRLHTEIQMAWHSHAVNATRDATHQPTINGVWLHGGGKWKTLPAIRYAQVQSDWPGLQGAADAAGAQGVPLHAGIVDGALLVVDDLLPAKRHDDWATWLRTIATIDHRLDPHATDAIDIVLCGRTVRTYASKQSDRYRIWRRREIGEALTE